MSYDVRFFGKFELTAPVILGKDTPRPKFSLGDHADLKLMVRHSEMDIEGVGPVTVTHAIGFSPEPDEQAMGYTHEDVQVAHDWATARGVELKGYLGCFATGDDDVWRYRVENGEVIDERPKLVWPNGEATEFL